MSNYKHKDLVGTDLHGIVGPIYADTAARDADTDFQVEANVDKVVKVLSPLSRFILSSVGPTVWIELGGVSAPFVGATPTVDGEEGVVPQPLAGEDTYLVEGSGVWFNPMMQGATSTTDGRKGFVPLPEIVDRGRYMRGDGAWKDDVRLYEVTTSGLINPKEESIVISNNTANTDLIFTTDSNTPEGRKILIRNIGTNPVTITVGGDVIGTVIEGTELLMYFNNGTWDLSYPSVETSEGLIAWAFVNPNRTASGEFTYRTDPKGIQVFYDEANSRWTIERDSSGILPSTWLSDYRYNVEIHKRIIENIGTSPVQSVFVGWTSGTSPNTGKSAYAILEWIDADGSKVVRPTSNGNSVVWIKIYKNSQ